MTRNEVLSKACNDCIKELYSFVQPSVEWEDFVLQNKSYIEGEKEYNKLKEKPDFFGYLEPEPFNFYYLPEEIMKDICDSYIYAYKLNSKQELLNTIEILKDYCKNPIVEKYIESENGNPGYRGYDHPDNLEKEIKKILGDVAEDNEYYQHKLQDKFFEFLDMAGDFYNWNGELNSFNVSVYLGPSPSSNKEAVIENWKKYRNRNIEINEEQIKKEYYGEDFDE